MSEDLKNVIRVALTSAEQKMLYDYITNLQTIEQQYSAILSENAELENKIINLQEENEELLKKSYSDDVRITKAIEYVRNIRQSTFTKYNSNEWNNCLSFNDDIEPLLKILQGSDE